MCIIFKICSGSALSLKEYILVLAPRMLCSLSSLLSEPREGCLVVHRGIKLCLMSE